MAAARLKPWSLSAEAACKPLTCHQQLDCHHVHATLVLSPVNNYCTQKKDGEMVYLLIFHVPFRFLHSFLTAKEAVQQSIRSICVFV